MLTTLVIGTAAYSSDGSAFSGSAYTTATWASRRIFGLRLTLDDTDYSSVQFTVIGCGPAIPFAPGQPVRVYTANDDGSSPVLRFAGDLLSPQKQDCDLGPAWGYACTDMKWRGDRVTLTAIDGSGTAQYNLGTTDPDYLFNTAGLTVGAIVTAILQAPANAAPLAGLGVGNFTLSGGVYTLPAATATDLAALTIVPVGAVQLRGESILSTLAAEVQRWHAQYTLWVQPDGTIRVTPVFGRTRRTLTQPWGGITGGDPVDNLSVNGPDLSGCYTAVQITGEDIAWAVLSTRDGTLVPAWTAPQQAAWTSRGFTSPTNSLNTNNAQDTGTIVSYTSTSVTIKSDSALVKWDVNYWNSNGGAINLTSILDDGGSSVGTTFVVQVTSCTAMAAGGTATITWDASQAVSGSGFTRYRLYATNTPLSKVGRAYYPATGSGGTLKKGLATWIGSHMVARSPFPFAWANMGKGASFVESINYPACNVWWSSNGQYPYSSLPCPVDLDPINGQVILSEPSVFLSAMMAGQTAALASGWPASYYQGLYADVEVAVPYSRGNLAARWPASGYSGGAYTKYGVQLTKVLPLAGYLWKGNTASLQQLAAQHLAVLQEPAISGSIRLHFDAWTPTFDPLTLPYALDLVTPGAASELDGVDLPVRSVTIEWPDSGPDIRLVTFGFDTQRRPFEGDSLYTHPTFAPGGWGMQEADLFVGPQHEGIAVGLDTGASESASVPELGSAGFEAPERGARPLTKSGMEHAAQRDAAQANRRDRADKMAEKVQKRKDDKLAAETRGRNKGTLAERTSTGPPRLDMDDLADAGQSGFGGDDAPPIGGGGG